MRVIHWVLPALLILPAASALGQSDDARYTLEKSPSGFVRMDKQTGEMSICEERSSQLVCKLAADERSAFEGEIDRLQSTLEALEKRVTKLESAPGISLPTGEDLDKTMTFMQQFFRGFMDIVKDLDRDLSDEPEATPQRT